MTLTPYLLSVLYFIAKFDTAIGLDHIKNGMQGFPYF